MYIFLFGERDNVLGGRDKERKDNEENVDHKAARETKLYNMRTGRRICSGFFSKSVSSLVAFRARAFFGLTALP